MNLQKQSTANGLHSKKIMKVTFPHTIENISGEKLTFLRIIARDGVEYLETESEVQPNAGPPMHVHYKQDESLTVLSGKIGDQELKGEKKFAGPGETVYSKPVFRINFGMRAMNHYACRDMPAPPITLYIFFPRSIGQ